MQLECKAPNCNLPQTSNSHCEIHAKIFVPKYLKYKKRQSELEPIVDSDLTNLIKLYNKYAKVHRMRIACMQKYFKPEFWDNGHMKMISDLWSSMCKIEKLISTKVLMTPAKKIETKESEITEDNDEIVFDDNDKNVEINTVELVVENKIKMLQWELLMRPSCLQHNWKLRHNVRQLLNTKFKNIIVTNCSDYAYYFDKQWMIEVAYNFIYSAYSLFIDLTKTRKIFTTNQPLIANCCLVRILYLMTHKDNMSFVLHLFGGICFILDHKTNIKVVMGFNIPIPDQAVVYKIDNKSYTMAEMRFPNYFACQDVGGYIKGKGRLHATVVYFP